MDVVGFEVFLLLLRQKDDGEYMCGSKGGRGGERTIKALLFTPLDITHSFTRNTHTHIHASKRTRRHMALKQYAWWL